ncbi:MAG: hypothetical protein A2Y57_00935 [Candidatus Woykebacteria bacterium RBG_13_40_7b]|uniref:Arylsulfotransferase N-terminal domain-containing protein n=1 Tax=Candidatus Woykebacteria bacterium RBG_13_40_7b TaxID=1802594 RepID=A0A1G1WC36_9BACT|nr:MAG: hypothetical protein A2Y57_00935 [Candidatus Woykebacteria bacterium RBG_13_40_7b]
MLDFSNSAVKAVFGRISKMVKIKAISIVIAVILVIITSLFLYRNFSNQDHQISSKTLSLIERGIVDPDFEVDIFKEDKVYLANTLLPDNHKIDNPRVIEVNILGEIIWEYQLPEDLKKYTNPGFDAEKLPNGNVLILLPAKGVFEIDQDKNIIWSYLDSKVSHDADRLPDGNTLISFGNGDGKEDSQVKEVDKNGNIIWSWKAKDYFDNDQFGSLYDQGWTHTNAVARLENGNTLISPRNFNLLIEVNPLGKVVKTFGKEFLVKQHDPEILANGNILIANHGEPHQAVEYNYQSEEKIWVFPIPEKKNWPVRDADRLPNGNTLITGSAKIFEVTPKGEVVWQFGLKKPEFDSPKDAPAKGFFKAQRIVQ